MTHDVADPVGTSDPNTMAEAVWSGARVTVGSDEVDPVNGALLTSRLACTI